MNNPYATALDGLILDDPVSAFFDFCREREKIRVTRESGNPFPWTDDPIFQKGRFLNVFRKDERGRKAILTFAKGIENAAIGNKLYDISKSIQDHVENNGFSIVRSYVGHGIGRNLHEDPQVPNFVLESEKRENSLD